MSLEDYNRHATHGAAAGAATTLPAMMGQLAYRQAADNASRLLNTPAGTYVPPAPTKAPHWMMHGAFKRGLLFTVVAVAVKAAIAILAGPAGGALGIVSFAFSLVFIAGLFLLLCGTLNFLTRRRNS